MLRITHLLSFFYALATVSAFPFVAQMDGVESSLFSKAYKRQQAGGSQPGGAATCPFNPTHVPAAPITAQYPYNGAINGNPGYGKGGILVPDPKDTAHKFVPPGPNDIRGPCPGLNAAANHNFLAHDGITTFNELVDAQQNVYNVGYDLAVTLAALGLTLTDGDIVTEKLSIGCDATTRTSYNPTLTGSEPGLDGHNKFESDTSLTRNDYFLAGGNNYAFNGTLFGMMDTTCNGLFNLENLALYRYQRYHQSLAQNPNFYFGPLSLLLYGAASFLYELMPSGTRNYVPDLYTISYFFGAKQNKDGTWSFGKGEQIPPNWTTRLTPFTGNDVNQQIVDMYLLHPVLFGGNTASGSFDALPSFGAIQNGQISASITTTETACLLYQLGTGSIPSDVNSVFTPSVAAINFFATKVGPQYANLGCPIALT